MGSGSPACKAIQVISTFDFVVTIQFDVPRHCYNDCISIFPLCKYMHSSFLLRNSTYAREQSAL